MADKPRQSEPETGADKHAASNQGLTEALRRPMPVLDHSWTRPPATGVQLKTDHLAVLAILGMYVLEIANTVFKFLMGTEIIGVAINGLNWFLLAILLYWLFFRTSRKLALKVFILLVIYVKWFVGAVYFQEYAYQKSMIVIPLLMVAIHEQPRFRRLFVNTLKKRYLWLLGLLLLTFLPFIGSVNLSGLGPYRFSAIWEIPHTIAYYLLAFMLLLNHKRLLPIVFLFLLIVYTGAKSATLAAAMYMGYGVLSGVQMTVKGSVRILSVLLMVAIAAYMGYFNFFLMASKHNFEPLMDREISDESYGAGRVGLNLIALEEIKRFSPGELIVGRSATSLYRLYSGMGGKWPHNDIVTVFFVYGGLGLAFYVYYLLVYPLRKSKRRVPVMIIEVSIVILMLTNGFYTYLSHLLYIGVFGLLYERELQSREATDAPKPPET